jgi:hypothetical protein
VVHLWLYPFLLTSSDGSGGSNFHPHTPLLAVNGPRLLLVVLASGLIASLRHFRRVRKEREAKGSPDTQLATKQHQHS